MAKNKYSYCQYCGHTWKDHDLRYCDVSRCYCEKEKMTGKSIYDPFPSQLKANLQKKAKERWKMAEQEESFNKRFGKRKTSPHRWIASGIQDVADALPDTEEQPEECCENGNFGDDHECMKQPEEPSLWDSFNAQFDVYKNDVYGTSFITCGEEARVWLKTRLTQLAEEVFGGSFGSISGNVRPQSYYEGVNEGRKFAEKVTRERLEDFISKIEG